MYFETFSKVVVDHSHYIINLLLFTNAQVIIHLQPKLFIKKCNPGMNFGTLNDFIAR